MTSSAQEVGTFGSVVATSVVVHYWIALLPKTSRRVHVDRTVNVIYIAGDGVAMTLRHATHIFGGCIAIHVLTHNMMGIMSVYITLCTREVSTHPCFACARVQVDIGTFPRGAGPVPTVRLEVKSQRRLILITMLDVDATYVCHISRSTHEVSC
jgi:hypothetical protein